MIIYILSFVVLSARSRQSIRLIIFFPFVIGLYTLNVGEYEVVVPKKVTEDGRFLSHDLDHHFVKDDEEFDASNTSWSHRKKRSLETVVNYHIPVGMLGHEQPLHLELWPSTDFLAPGIVVERRADVSAHRRSPPSVRATRCHYKGIIRDQPGSQVAISACDGLVSAFTRNKAGSHKPV